MLDMLARQVASPVQFVKGLQHPVRRGARVFVEVGPKRALQGFAADVLGDDEVRRLATNHPKAGDIVTLQQRTVRPVRRGPRRRHRAVRRPTTSRSQTGATAQPRRGERRAEAPAPCARGASADASTASSAACSPSSSSAAAR